MKPALIISIYLLWINLFALLQMKSDKQKTMDEGFSLPNRSLFLTALTGGSVGTLAGMYLFQHKTKNFLFKFGIPAVIVLQIALGIWLLVTQPWA